MSIETIGDDLPEIRVEVYDKIDHWRDRLDQTAKLKKRDVFERAAADLFLEAEYERDLAAVQAIADAIYVLGRDYAGLNDDDIQYIMVGAKARAEQPINGCATTQSAGGKNALEAFPLRDFENVRIQTEGRNYLVKGLLANTGLAVIWGPPKCGKSFWSADLGMHIALGWNYRGHRVQQAPVVYIALEGRHGFPARGDISSAPRCGQCALLSTHYLARPGRKIRRAHRSHQSSTRKKSSRRTFLGHSQPIPRRLREQKRGHGPLSGSG